MDLLKIIHENGNEWKLNAHFVPQQLGCFLNAPVNMWSLAAPISDPALQRALASAIGATGLRMPHVHSNKPGVWIRISERAQAILDNITRPEYDALKEALGGQNGADAHVAASGSCSNAACGVPCTRRDGACVTW